jgi:hypothetical protein
MERGVVPDSPGAGYLGTELARQTLRHCRTLTTTTLKHLKNAFYTLCSQLWGGAKSLRGCSSQSEDTMSRLTEDYPRIFADCLLVMHREATPTFVSQTETSPMVSRKRRIPTRRSSV